MQFQDYQTLVEKYIKCDWREINFQNRVVLVLLESLFVDRPSMDIVDVSEQYKNRESTIHTRKEYAKDYTPDLLIAENWNYRNKKNLDVRYLAVTEIKSPAIDPISKKKQHTLDEVECYLNLERKVILTDCYQWEFYVPNQGLVKSVVLYDGKSWKKQHWQELCNYIKEFVG